MNERIDIAVIGGGPAGLSAAINGVARGKTVRVLSASETPLKRAEAVDNYLGFYNITGYNLIKKFEEHALALGISTEHGRAANIMPLGNYFMINFSGNIIEATTVILAIGVARVREIPGESEFLGKGVSYCATCDGMLYRGKKAVIWGLASDAVEEANFLHSIGVDLTFVAKGGRPEELNTDIPFISGALSEIIGGNSVTAVKINSDIMDTDGVFILRQAIAPTNLVSGLETEDGYIKVNNKMETNIRGLFAAGDCTGAPLQLAKAVGEGLVAAQTAAKYIDSLNKL